MSEQTPTPEGPIPEPVKDHKFWLEEPCSLFASVTLLPHASQTVGEQLNSVTRITIIIVAILYLMGYEKWLMVGSIAMASIVVFWLMSRACKKRSEGFSVTPTYLNPNYEQTVVAPTFAEEWQNPPPVYDVFAESVDDFEFIPPKTDPRSYPYGEYLTNMNMLPADEHDMNMLGGGATQAREYANSAFLRNDLSYRDNIMQIQKLKIARRFRHNCNDVVSPYESY